MNHIFAVNISESLHKLLEYKFCYSLWQFSTSTNVVQQITTTTQLDEDKLMSLNSYRFQ